MSGCSIPEAQEAFLNLPQEDQEIPRGQIHHELAHKLNSTQSAVSVTMEAEPEAKEKDPNVVELDTENYGAPPENSGIKVSTKDASLTEPQAWVDEKGNWFYNFAGAMQLAKVLGRTLPNIDQLVAAINANPDNFRQGAAYCNGVFSEFSDFWSSSESGFYRAYCAYLERRTSFVGRGCYERHKNYSVRFIVDKK